MKLFFISSISAATILSKENASSFLARNRRANGWGEEVRYWNANLERECIEEACDFNEFDEVLEENNDLDINFKDYLDCKNYIKEDDPNEKQLLRKCLNLGDENVQQSQQQQMQQDNVQQQQGGNGFQQQQNGDAGVFVIPDRPEPETVKPTVKPTEPPTVATTTEYTYTDRMDMNRSGKLELPPCGKSGYLCASPRIPQGWANADDDLFQHIKTNHLNANIINTVYCSTKRPPSGMLGGQNSHKCRIRYNDGCSSEFVFSYCNGCPPPDSPRLESKSIPKC